MFYANINSMISLPTCSGFFKIMYLFPEVCEFCIKANLYILDIQN